MLKRMTNWLEEIVHASIQSFTGCSKTRLGLAAMLYSSARSGAARNLKRTPGPVFFLLPERNVSQNGPVQCE